MQWTPEEIRRRRLAHGYTSQKALADALGLSRRAVINWESGTAEPRGSSRRALERVLGGDPDDSDEDRVLRRVSAGRLWAELQTRYYAAIDAAQEQSSEAGPSSPPSGGGRFARPLQPDDGQLGRSSTNGEQPPDTAGGLDFNG
ncbi:MAG: helix-turn-helix transcriptional regulator [Acidimicrobiia bacterium]